MIPLLLPFGKRVRIDGIGAVHLYKVSELHDKALPLRSVQKSMDSQRIVNGQSSFSHIKLMTTNSQRQRKYVFRDQFPTRSTGDHLSEK